MGGSAEPSRQSALKEMVKSAARRAGQATASARMTPDFLLVGAQRSGTTTLHLALKTHPLVVMNRLHKGVNYFDLRYDRGPQWYRGHFPLRAYARARTTWSDGSPITGESSGYYMFHPLAPERIGRDLPDAKLIALVRDPVERAYSAHKHEHARGFDTEPFERAIELEEERLAGEVERMIADPSYESLSHRHHAYLSRGRYIEQLDVLAKHCARDNLLVVDADAFFADPDEMYARILAFLGLPHQPTTIRRTNARPRSPMPDSLRTRLGKHFEEYDEALTSYLGAIPSWRQ
ncbi:MAG: hypothetical protein QOG53_407 [Frankiales bacterium]|nr:hypothetical protein [Frankiales bacterium]